MPDVNSCYNGCFVLRLIHAFIATVAALFRSRVDVALEVLPYVSRLPYSNANALDRH